MAAEGDDGSVKLEVEVKREPVECVVCGNRGTQTADVTSSTTASGTALLSFFHRYTQQDLSTASSKHICKNCHDLINVLEQAELEYLKLKETFEAIINKNPLFHTQAQNPQPVGLVKVEIDEYNDKDACDNNESDEEPLAIVKKKRPRKAVKSKKKVVSPTKRRGRPRNSDKWSCDRCGERGTGGAEQAAAHMWTMHTEMITDLPPVPELKKEDSVDGGVEENIVRDSDSTQENGSSEDYHFNNGVDPSIPLEEGFADDSSDYLPSAYSDEESKGSQEKMKILNKTRKKREPKTWHHCDQCNAKYSNIKRLEMHREKHSEGKPPFICEVCGARYKHKRACDIHVALHKGISDWKCEECNKLFPSKGALQRHNNIHTGKLNYQCDLCGKSFIHTSSFKMHKLSHSGVKPHSCDVCGLALMTRSHLKRHKRVHSGEKRHECPLCGKRFSERYNLVAHSRAHEAPGAPPALPPQPRRRLFRCAFCVERFERRYMLERHMSVVHGRTLERAPPTPRNTMSKLLKAQAQRHPQPASLPDTHSNTPEAEAKEERSPESRAASAGLPQKIHLSDAGGAAAAWAEWRQHYAQ